VDQSEAQYLVPYDIHYRLQNWARYARVRKWPSHCRSIEHQYLPEAGDVFDPPPPRITVDLWDALAVEKAWAYKMPFKEKMLLKAHYILAPVMPKSGDIGAVWSYHIRRVCRQLAIKRARYFAETYRAALMMRNVLGGRL